MIRISDPLAEWRVCGHLRQPDIDRLLVAGVSPLAMAEGPSGTGFALTRDRIVPHAAARRFEFSRHDETAGDEVCALVVVALDVHGRPGDLVAFRAGATPFIGSWLRAGREGVVVVDPVRAAPMLRDAGTMAVTTSHERRRLVETMTVRLPPIIVRPVARRAAA